MIDEQAPAVVAQATERPIGATEESDFPGNINVGGGFFEGHYPGNKLVAFEVRAGPLTDQVNAHFASTPGAVVTGMWFDRGTAYVLFTRLMSREEAEGLQKFSAEVKAKINAERTKKAELDAEQEKRNLEAETKKTTEFLRLAELGRKCEENHPKGGETPKRKKGFFGGD